MPLLHTRGTCLVLCCDVEGLTCRPNSYKRYHRTYSGETLLQLHYVTSNAQEDMTCWVSFCALR